MEWRRIFAPMVGDPEDAAAMCAAGAFADQFKAHVDVVLLKPDPTTFVPPIGFGRLADDFRAELVKSAEQGWKETEESLRATFAGLVEKEGLTVTEEARGPGAATARFTALEPDAIDEAALRYARSSDVTVVATPADQGKRIATGLAERLLLKSGRPVLSVPESGLPEEINRIGLAWDGSREASVALAAAAPFLAIADQIDIVTVDDSNAPAAHPEDIIEYLAWRGINATAHVLEANYQTIGDRLIGFLEEQKWDMAAMGAYGRAPLFENLFAGPTRGVPLKAKIPVLQAH